MNIKRYQKQICFVLALFIAGAFVGLVSRSQKVEAKVLKTQKELAGEVLRFHVLANGDSEEDQALKLKVKNGVLDYMKAKGQKSQSLAETKEWMEQHLEELAQTAVEIVAKNGYEYPVTARLTSSYFPDKSYGDVTFPAGTYEALRIEIGEGAGRNWWCVLYPNLCFTDATCQVVPKEGKEELKEVLQDDEYEMVTSTSQFKIKWFFFGDDKEN